MKGMIIRERNDLLELLNDGCVELYADFGEKEIRTNCGDFYFDSTFPMAAFLEFAACVRARYEQIATENDENAEPYLSPNGPVIP